MKLNTVAFIVLATLSTSLHAQTEWEKKKAQSFPPVPEEIKKEITTATSINLENKKIKAFSQFLSKL